MHGVLWHVTGVECFLHQGSVFRLSRNSKNSSEVFLAGEASWCVTPGLQKGAWGRGCLAGGSLQLGSGSSGVGGGGSGCRVGCRMEEGAEVKTVKMAADHDGQFRLLNFNFIVILYFGN